MFRITEKRTIEWPVAISVPQDGGKVKQVMTRVEFELLDQADYEAVSAEGDIALMHRAVVGWPSGEFQDAKGGTLAFDSDSLEMLMQIPYVRAGFVTAYLHVMAGREAARKNSR